MIRGLIGNARREARVGYQWHLRSSANRSEFSLGGLGETVGLRPALMGAGLVLGMLDKLARLPPG